MGEVEKELTPSGMLLENARAPKEGFPPVNLGVDVCAGIDEVEDFGVGWLLHRHVQRNVEVVLIDPFDLNDFANFQKKLGLVAVYQEADESVCDWQ